VTDLCGDPCAIAIGEVADASRDVVAKLRRIRADIALAQLAVMRAVALGGNGEGRAITSKRSSVSCSDEPGTNVFSSRNIPVDPC